MKDEDGKGARGAFQRARRVNESLCCRLCEPGGTTGGPLLHFSVSSSSMSLIVRLKTNDPTRLAFPGSRGLEPEERLALSESPDVTQSARIT